MEILYKRSGDSFSVREVKVMNCDNCAKMTKFDGGGGGYFIALNGRRCL